MNTHEIEIILVLGSLSVLGLGSLLLRDFVFSLARRDLRELEQFKSTWLWPFEPFLLVVLSLIFFSGSGWMILFFPLFFLMIALFLMRSGTGGIARDQAWCLHFLALSAQAGLPSAQALRNIASDIRGRFGVALWAAAERVELGGSMSDALAVHAVFPPHIVAALRVAESGGGRMMAATLRTLKAERQFLAELRGRFSYRLLLPVASLCFTLTAGAFLAMFIFPKFGDMLKAMCIWRSSVDFIPMMTHVLLVLAAVALLSLIVYTFMASNAPSRLKLALSEFVGNIFSYLPPFRRFSHDVALMRALPGVAVQLECGVSVPQALRNVATPDISRGLALHFLRAADQVERGEPLPSALKNAGFSDSLCMLVAGARTTEHLVHALHTEAQWHQRHVQRFENILTAAIPIALIFFVGAVQFALIVGTFEPYDTIRGALRKK